MYGVNLKVMLKTFGILLALSLIGFAFSIVGVAGTLVDSIWKLLALDIGLSLLVGYAYPLIRGVRKGDELSTNTSLASISGPGMSIAIGNFGIANAYALSNGRIGDKIRVRLLDGRRAEAKVAEYSGLFSPAKVQILEVERAEPVASVEHRHSL
jgi:hypothetical protein